ncbi:Type III secretion system protein (plasmid) [Pseudomonas antarctica]|uniref:Type III secretion system protein n=1 Tax=Pseudomonas antarctica TaxID=219572 RepID=A0A172Z9S0_9PSED|nr:type III secretion system export apparatus subunit SctU [Pseudomonas antarctica]ANF89265.1 Type III secretion system protein [Pseudomonas antarctica]
MSEKTEKATPKAERDAREKGQVGQSQDLTKLLVLLGVSEVCLGAADDSVNRLQTLIAQPLQRLREPFMHTLVELGGEAVWTLVSFTLMTIGVAILMRLVGSWLQIGFLFAPKALKIDLGKINPISHLKQMFSGQSLMNLLMSILKALVIAITLYVSIKPLVGKLVLLADTDLTTYWHALLAVFRSVLHTTLGLLLVMALVDFAMQKYFHAKKLRMSHEDIKTEYKQSEGDPHVKGHRKHLAQELLNGAPPQPRKPVEEADVLLVNPTHYAVALYYRPGQTPLPVIHCKGEDEDALALIKRAQKAKIPVVQCVWLARALYKVRTGRHIPRPTLLEVAHIYQVIKQLDEVTADIIQLEES